MHDDRKVGVVRHDQCRVTEHDIYLFCEGTHACLYNKFGAHEGLYADGVAGVFFAVWAPNAKKVSVVGDFNGWDERA
ncbi:MAG: 1,4-alpha-glucan branching enzyme, partial [Candidatus Omnitrophota bacterium]